MPAKKAARSNAGTSGMDTIMKWVYAIGMVVAGLLGAFAFQNQVVTVILALLAVLVGLFYFDYEDVGQFGLRVLVLFFAKEGLAMLPFVGTYITGFFGGWVFFLFPIVLMLALRFFWHKRLAPLFMGS